MEKELSSTCGALVKTYFKESSRMYETVFERNEGENKDGMTQIELSLGHSDGEYHVNANLVKLTEYGFQSVIDFGVSGNMGLYLSFLKGRYSKKKIIEFQSALSKDDYKGAKELANALMAKDKALCETILRNLGII